MSRMRSQLDDLIAQQGQSTPYVTDNSGMAPQPVGAFSNPILDDVQRRLDAMGQLYPPSAQPIPFQQTHAQQPFQAAPAAQPSFQPAPQPVNQGALHPVHHAQGIMANGWQPAPVPPYAALPSQLPPSHLPPALMSPAQMPPAQIYPPQISPVQPTQAPIGVQMPAQMMAPAPVAPLPVGVPLPAAAIQQVVPQPIAVVEAPRPAPANAEMSNIMHSLDRLSDKLGQMKTDQAAQTARAISHSAQNVLEASSPAMTQELAALRQEVKALRGISTNNAAGINAADKDLSNNLTRIAENIRHLQDNQTNQPDEFDRVSASLQSIHSQIVQLNLMATDGSIRVDMAPLRDELDINFSELAKRLEKISSDRNQIGELTQAIDGSHADIVSRLHVLSENANESSNAGAVAIQQHLDDRLKEITDGVEALSTRVVEGSDTRGGDIEQLNGLASHINRLSEKIDNMSIVSENSGTSDVAQSEIAARNNVDIISKLDDLVSRMDALQASGPLHAESAADGKLQLETVQNQLAEITSKLSNGGTGGAMDLSPFDARLDTIEKHVAASRDIAIEVAGKVANEAANNAATQAVNETIERVKIRSGQSTSGEIDPEILASIAGDIKNLQASNETQNNDNLQVFDAVRGSLNTISDRLGDIVGQARNNELAQAKAQQQFVPTPARQLVAESRTQQASAPVVESDQSVAGNYDAEVKAPSVQMEESRDATAFVDAPEVAGGSSEVASEPPVKPVRSDAPTTNVPGVDQGINESAEQEVVPPSLDMQELPEVDAPHEAEDVPLEPGSGGPDLAALVRQANLRQKQEPETSEEAAGTDFIAAARRAAQAAAMEASVVQQDKKTKSKSKSKEKKIGNNFFARHKKVVMMTAATVLVAVMAVPIATAFLGSNDQQVADASLSTEPTIIEQSVAEAPIEPASQVRKIPTINAENVEDEKEEATEIAKNGTTEKLPEILKVPQNQQLAAAQEPTRAFAVENQKIDASKFEAQGENQVAIPASDPAPMPNDRVGTIQLRQAAASGDLAALFEVGRIYTDGSGVERDLIEAAKWYEMAASRDFGPAQYRLGNFYEKGHGIIQDIDKAADWYGKAADQGNALAMHNLAVISAMGTPTVKADMAAAGGWFKKAAELGIKDSQVNLGILYTKGLGIEKDIVQAYKWFAIASRAGDSDASAKRDTIAGVMQPVQLEQARAEVELWKKDPLNEAANIVSVPETWRGTGAATGKMSKRDTIRATQVMLSKNGFDAGPADGKMGAKTRDAIIAFQQSNGMSVDGKITAQLFDKLKSTSV